MARRLLCLALIGGLGVSSYALADDTSRRDRGGVKAKGLSAGERKALDIRRVSATGGHFGLIVTVEFRGNIERALGRRGLRRALVAMVLRPRRGAGKAAVLATRGRGGGERVLRSTRSSNVAVVRSGRRLRFIVLGRGLPRVRAIQVKAFARAPGGGARAAQKGIILSRRFYNAILDGRPVDGAGVPPPSNEDAEACDSLAEQIDQLEEDSERRPITNTQFRRLLAARRRLIVRFDELDCQVKILVLSRGYQHRPGETDICADVIERPNLGDIIFALLERGSTTTEVKERGVADERDARRVIATVTSYGTYRLKIFTGRSNTVDLDIDVPEPPPERTKTCR